MKELVLPFSSYDRLYLFHLCYTDWGKAKCRGFIGQNNFTSKCNVALTCSLLIDQKQTKVNETKRRKLVSKNRKIGNL